VFFSFELQSFMKSFHYKIASIQNVLNFVSIIDIDSKCQLSMIILVNFIMKIIIIIVTTMTWMPYDTNYICPGKFLAIVGQKPSGSKSNWLHADIFWFFFIESGYILHIPLKWWMNFPKVMNFNRFFHFSNLTDLYATTLIWQVMSPW
jgi:hypothetical protein